jgi:uncharacterized protein YqhQ
MVWQAMYSHWKIRLRSFGRLLALPALLMARPAHEGGEESDVAGSLSSEGKARTTGEKETQILLGGQAVIEGVLMRSPRAYCVAVRTPSRGIIEDRGILPSPGDRWRVWRWPFFRGLGVLGQTLKAKGEDSSHVKAEFPAWMMWAQVAFSIAFFIVLYKFIPLVIATQVENFGLSGGWLGFNLIDGIVRLAIFLGFLALISLWGDIRRTFEYHGGEHMVVYTWEAQKEVTVENARQFPPEHPRCGTSFLMVVILTSLLLYALIPVEGFLLRLAVRLALLPVIVATSYEVIRAAGRNQSSAFWSAAVWPGIMLQRLITTKQPDDGQIEVAIQALEGALEVERSTSTSTGQPAPAGVN